MNKDTQLIWEAASGERGAGFISHRAGGALKELVDAFEKGNKMEQIRDIFNSNNPDVQNAVIDLLKASNHSNPSRKAAAGTILTFITDQS